MLSDLGPVAFRHDFDQSAAYGLECDLRALVARFDLQHRADLDAFFRCARGHHSSDIQRHTRDWNAYRA